MAEVKRPRRYYLHQRVEARQAQDDAELIWKAKQEAEPGTVLVEGFPQKAALSEIGYTTIEDLDGADEKELQRAGLSQRQAQAVISAL